jgi:hypothetical protein
MVFFIGLNYLYNKYNLSGLYPTGFGNNYLNLGNITTYDHEGIYCYSGENRGQGHSVGGDGRRGGVHCVNVHWMRSADGVAAEGRERAFDQERHGGDCAGAHIRVPGGGQGGTRPVLRCVADFGAGEVPGNERVG